MYWKELFLFSMIKLGKLGSLFKGEVVFLVCSALGERLCVSKRDLQKSASS